MNRRTLLAAASAAGLAGGLRAKSAGRVNSFELLPVRATERTAWLFVRLTTDSGLSGIGEASDAFGFASTSKENAQRMESELRRFFEPSRLITAATADLTGDVELIAEVLEEAYQVLRDPHRRSRYRRAIEAQAPS